MDRTRKISPFKCRVWEMHDRLGEQIDVDSCRTLIDSISVNGQRHPVLARPLSGKDGYEVELIYGARRLFAAQQLGIDLLVDVREMDDRSALIEMDVENRVRTDISPYERGLSYRRWLNTGHFKSQAEIAKALHISEAQISRLLKYAELPTAVLSAFDNVRDIREEWAVTLAQRCRDQNLREIVIKKARERFASARKDSPQVVYEALTSVGHGQVVKYKPRDEIIKGSGGMPLVRVAYRAKSVHLIVQRNRVTAPALREAIESIRAILDREDSVPVVVNRFAKSSMERKRGSNGRHDGRSVEAEALG